MGVPQPAGRPIIMGEASGRMISEDWLAQRLLFSGECETNISMGVFPGVCGVSPGPRGGILTTWATDNIPGYFEHDFIEILQVGPGGGASIPVGILVFQSDSLDLYSPRSYRGWCGGINTTQMDPLVDFYVHFV